MSNYFKIDIWVFISNYDLEIRYSTKNTLCLKT